MISDQQSGTFYVGNGGEGFDMGQNSSIIKRGSREFSFGASSSGQRSSTVVR